MRDILCAFLVIGLAACGSSGSGSAQPKNNPGQTTDGGTTDGGTSGGGGTPDGGTPSGVVAVIAFDGTSGSGQAPDTEKFDGSGSHSLDPNATVTGCAWDFGDGSAGTGCHLSHTYTDAGEFTVTLTATDSTGAEGTAHVQVSVKAAPSSRIVWQRGFSRAARVGADWDRQIAASEGSVLMSLDPDSGKTLASHDFSPDPSQEDSTSFRDRLGIAPGTATIWGTIRSGSDFRVTTGICAFDLSGTKDCVQGGTDETHLTPMTMSADGSVGWGVGPFDYRALVRGPDGTQRTTELWSTEQYDGTELIAVAREPNGDAVVAVHAGTNLQVDGQKMGPSDALFRIDAAGHLVWWKKVPFSIKDCGLSAAGTVVCVVTSSASFTWGDGSASGTALVVADASGTERFVRKLAGAVADSAVLSVLPVGRVAIAINRPSCGGGEVFRYDLAGAETWHWDLASRGCDVTLSSVSILPNDVLVAGAVNQATDLGAGPLGAGGFVLELGPGS